MTTNVFTWAAPTRPRRATYVSAPADVIARRLHVGVTSTALVLSAAAVAILGPLVL